MRPPAFPRLRNSLYSLPARRFVSTEATAPLSAPSPRSSALQRTKKYVKFTGYFCLSSVLGVFAIGGAIFIHDAFTYSEKHIERVPVSPLALHPEKGGPKNLPVARVQVDDEEDEENKRLAEKPRLVIVGGGWGVRAQLESMSTG